MKYLKLSSVLFALFFAFGCGSKSVEKNGNTTQSTVAGDTQDTQAQGDNEPNETVVSQGGKNLPEGGFMPDDSAIADSDSADNDGAYANTNDNSGNSAYEEGSADENEGDSVALNALTAIYFDFDKYDIRPDMKRYVIANADFIKKQNIKSVVLQGNTDEFGGDEYNTALGLKRALSVRDALVLQGLPKSMFSTVSYGMHKPVCKEKTAECYAKNRRTDIVEK